jgi:hypothetical protein
METTAAVATQSRQDQVAINNAYLLARDDARLPGKGQINAVHGGDN